MNICVYMKRRIDIRIDENKLTEIDAYCLRHNKTRTAFIEKGIELVYQHFNVKGEYRLTKRHWNKMYSTRKHL